MSDPQKYVFTNNQRRILFIISAILVAVLVIISVLNSIQIHELNIDIKYFTPNNIYITSIFLFLSIILYSLRFLKKTSKMNPENIHDLLNNPIHEKLQAMEDSWNKNARWISYLGIAALGWLLMSNHDASFTARCWIISSIILFSISLFFSCISDLASMFFVHVCLGMEDMGTWKLLKEILFAIAYNLMSVWHIVTLFSFMIAIIFAIGGLINIIF